MVLYALFKRSAEIGPEGFAGLRVRDCQPISFRPFPSEGFDRTRHTERTAEQSRALRYVRGVEGQMTALWGVSLERYHDGRIHDGERADTNDRGTTSPVRYTVL